ncbi:MAG: hypothetical protein ACKPKO_33740, partial [Candidatus Fonsibacter sp.]
QAVAAHLQVISKWTFPFQSEKKSSLFTRYCPKRNHCWLSSQTWTLFKETTPRSNILSVPL